MVLIVGGAGSGKREFAESLGVASFSEDPRCGSAIYHLEAYVAAHPGCGEELLPLLLQKDYVLCDEVGSGIIPIAKEQRLAREEIGRLCIALASQATAVVRMVCGLPQIIKGAL